MKTYKPSTRLTVSFPSASQKQKQMVKKQLIKNEVGVSWNDDGSIEIRYDRYENARDAFEQVGIRWNVA